MTSAVTFRSVPVCVGASRVSRRYATRGPQNMQSWCILGSRQLSHHSLNVILFQFLIRFLKN